MAAAINKLESAVSDWIVARNAPITGLFGIAQLNDLRKAEINLEIAYIELKDAGKHEESAA